MPIYEYECKKCGKLEILQKITEESLNKCPNCNSVISKIISVTGEPKFNGSGFYKTDYVRKNKK